MLQSNIPWPGGARCAICISWDIDIDTTIHLERPDTGYKEYGVLSSLRYEEVGIHNVVEALEEPGLQQTFFVCGWCLERYPGVCGEIISHGHEVAHHGYLHEPPNEQSPERESPKPPQQAVEYFMSTFDAAYRIGGFATTIWHPEISGRPSRLLAWADMVRELQKRGDVWIAPLRDIAGHVLKLSEAGEISLREVSVPFYTGPIPELERS